MVGNILIVDGVATNRIVFKVALEDAYYRPVLAADGESCLNLTRQMDIDLIMLDLSLPDQTGVSLIKQLRADPATREIPVVAFAAREEADIRLQALQAGADDVLEKGAQPQSLLARIRNLLRGRGQLDGLAQGAADACLLGLAEAAVPFQGPATISFLFENGQTARDRYDGLSSLMPHNIVIQTREDAFVDTAHPTGLPIPDVFLIDGSRDGLRLLSELRSRPATRHSAICIVNSDVTSNAASIAFDMGADDVVGADVSPAELALRLQTLIRRKRRDDQLRANVQDNLRLAVIDPLTGLHNRRYGMPQLAAIAERAALDASVFAVMVIDLDRFKSVNDRLGHAAGDAVLVEVARRLKANLRSDDVLARIGGEEFLVVLPNTSFDQACVAADRLCRAVERQPVTLGFSASSSVTVSIGLAVSQRIGGRNLSRILLIVPIAPCFLPRRMVETRSSSASPQPDTCAASFRWLQSRRPPTILPLGPACQILLQPRGKGLAFVFRHADDQINDHILP